MRNHTALRTSVMISLLLACLVLLGSGSTQNSVIPCDMYDPDQLVDDLLSLTRPKLRLRPLALANRNGIVNLFGGQIIGLATLNRSGPVETLHCNSSYLSLRAPLATEKPIRAQYSWDRKLPTKTARGVANARVRSLAGHVILTRLSDGPWEVEEVLLTPSDVVEVNISGLAKISWLWSRAITYVTSSLERSFSIAPAEATRVALVRALHDLET